jgi:AcrR family transcriptional regulator
MVKRSRGYEAKLRAVRLAAAAIDQLGEPAVRLADLAERVGVVQVTLLRWFGSLQNLLDAAHLHRFESAQVVLAPWLPAALAAAEGVADVQRALDMALDDALTSEGQAHRGVLANLLSIALHRPSLAERLWPRLSALRSDLSAALRATQARGLIPATVEVEGAAVMLRAHLFGLLVLDLHPPLAPEGGRGVAEELRHGLHLTVLQQPAPERVAPLVAIGRVTQPLRSADVELDSVGERMLAETVRLLDTAGESGVRVVDIVGAVGVNVSQLHRRFGDLQRLIVLAQAQRLAGMMMHDLGVLQRAPREEEVEGLRAQMERLAHEVIGGDRRASRLRRLSALGASFLRPPLQAVAAAVHADYFQRHAALLEQLGERQRLPIPPVRLSMWATATIFGLSLADGEFDPPAMEPLVRITYDMWQRMLRIAPSGSAPPVRAPWQYGAVTLEPIVEDPTPLASTPPRNATSDAIVAAAEGLMRSDGPAGATPVRIAAAADVNDATINYYFRSREHLHLALVHKAAEERQARLRHTLGTLAGATTAVWLQGLLAWCQREGVESEHGALWRQLRALGACEPQVGRAVREGDAGLLALLATEFGLSPSDPRMEPFLVAWEGVQLLMVGMQGLFPSAPDAVSLQRLAARLQAPLVAELERALAALRATP